MKKGVALFLSAYIFFGSLFPGNGYSEYSAVPSLIKHFQHHRALESPGINFIDFVMLHYADYKHVTSDPVNHNALPVHHKVTSLIYVDMIALVSDINAPSMKLSNSNITNFYNEPFLPVCLADSIFHPPKV